jgi:flavin reductase (DIM6/NTAB) family NADH-FMN oxidoreductase RutF
LFPQTAHFNTAFFPQNILLLTCGENMIPMGYWTVISKDPFRFLICMQVGNHTLTLLKKHKEAALHFMPWEARERVVQAGHLSGRDGDKVARTGFSLIQAEKLQHTKLVEGADAVFETVVAQEIMRLSREFALFVLDVVAVHIHNKDKRTPILYLSQEDFATLGECWQYKK